MTYIVKHEFGDFICTRPRKFIPGYAMNGVQIIKRSLHKPKLKTPHMQFSASPEDDYLPIKILEVKGDKLLVKVTASYLNFMDKRWVHKDIVKWL